MASLSPEKILASTPAGLARLNDPAYRVASHVSLLNKRLIDVAAGRCQRLMVFMPPRHGKSALISEVFPAWFLATHPDSHVIIASYSAALAQGFGRKARDILAEHGPRFYGVRVKDDQRAAHDWGISRHKGGCYTCGVGGSLTGFGGRVLIVDDPFKNMAEAESATIRDMTYQWYLSVARTRLTPHGSIILVNTRWHHDDLAGRLLKDAQTGGDQWEVVSLPAICESGDDLLGRRSGQALWPERFDEQALAQTKASVGSRVWVSLYQQRPSPERGAVFQREWVKRYRELPALRQKVITVDGAWKDGVLNDWSVIATWATDGVNYYCIDLWRDKVQYPVLLQAIKDQAAKHRPNAVCVEDAASGIPAIQELRRTTNLPVVAIPTKGSKQSRADGVSPLFEAGKVYVPDGAPWAGDWIEEHIQFPLGEHDDQVDTTSMALARLRDGTGVLESAPSPFDLTADDFSLNPFDM